MTAENICSVLADRNINAISTCNSSIHQVGNIWSALLAIAFIIGSNMCLPFSCYRSDRHMDQWLSYLVTYSLKTGSQTYCTCSTLGGNLPHASLICGTAFSKECILKGKSQCHHKLRSLTKRCEALFDVFTERIQITLDLDLWPIIAHSIPCSHCVSARFWLARAQVERQKIQSTSKCIFITHHNPIVNYYSPNPSALGAGTYIFYVYIMCTTICTSLTMLYLFNWFGGIDDGQTIQ